YVLKYNHCLQYVFVIFLFLYSLLSPFWLTKLLKKASISSSSSSVVGRSSKCSMPNTFRNNSVVYSCWLLESCSSFASIKPRAIKVLTAPSELMHLIISISLRDKG